MENVIVRNVYLLPTDAKLFFGDEPVEYIEDGLDMYDVLVLAGIFSSKGQARKNWTRTDANIPKGFSDFRNIGKLHKRLCLLRVHGGMTDG